MTMEAVDSLIAQYRTRLAKCEQELADLRHIVQAFLDRRANFSDLRQAVQHREAQSEK